MTPSELERFEAKYVVDPNSGCWLWTACVNPAGYGQMGVGPRGTKQRARLTHRLSYEHFRGPIPKGLHVLHRCDVPACCNPEHLFLGTQADNMADMDAKGRRVPPPHVPGELAAAAILTESSVREIRALVAAGHRHYAIAERFGVSRPTITAIACGRTWRHVA